ncbi:hypothetical protein [Streptomyces sp. PT12]|uniref:hypothetical protein n=1 Tax=Streptomyces sp. PT12 TaxID=1510197 RepID=UPI0015EF022D|nr:hypothetical protein [Streptomyces sp. PT12]
MRGHAELSRVWPRDRRLRLVGALHDHDPGRNARAYGLLLVHREAPERRLHYPGGLKGTAFDVSCPVADLAPDDLPLPAVWDLYLAPDPAADPADALRVGKVLDDISGKKKIMVYPAQPLTRPGGTARVRPYFTIKDNLSVGVTATP